MSDIAPVLYAPGDLIPVDLDLELLLGTAAPDGASEFQQTLALRMREEYTVNPLLPRTVMVRMPRSIDIQRIQVERQFAEEALDAKSYDLEPEEYAAKKAALLTRFQERILAYVEPLPEGCPWRTAEELPIGIINHLWETIVYFGSGLTRREVQGSIGRSGSGSPGPETTTASAPVARVVDATTPPRRKNASTR